MNEVRSEYNENDLEEPSPAGEAALHEVMVAPEQPSSLGLFASIRETIRSSVWGGSKAPSANGDEAEEGHGDGPNASSVIVE